MFAGDTANIFVVVYDGETAARKNIANATVKWVLYDEDAQAAVLTKTTASGITITNGLLGELTIAIAPANTVSLTPGVYYHEVEVTDETGNVSTVLTGHITINPSRI